jgi:hypothetical protein
LLFVSFGRITDEKNIETLISPIIKQYISETNHFPMIHHVESDVPIGEWGGSLGMHYEYIYK